jgi:putative flippase GtrA
MVRFGIVGGMNTAVDWGLFFVFNLLYNSVSNEPLVSHRYLYLLANAIAFSAGIANSFLWNKHWTFNAGGSRRWRHEVIVFLMVSLASLAINTAGLQVLRSMITGTSLYTVAVHKLGTTVVTMTWNFFGYRFLAFRHAASSTGSGEPRE